jgi:hypothetical protein
MKAFWKKIKRILLWIVVAFFASTILSVIVLRWVPVFFTPLMFIRVAQQVSDGKEMALHHHWVALEWVVRMPVFWNIMDSTIRR